jgi:hypothetical protein
MPDVGTAPGLSELFGWSTEHLTEGADYLDAAADRSEAAVVGVWQDLHTHDWQGETADAARARAGSDKHKVSPVAADLREGARIAREGASNVLAAQNSLRYAVQDAWNAGFNVYDDYSVKDAGTPATAAERAARQAQAEALAGSIRQRAAQLVALDQQIGARISSATASVHTLDFAEAPVTNGSDDERKKRNSVQLVDRKTGPGGPFPQDPPPYPVNDVIAEATDLDGNHVILRRGYYDARTKEGWGWDKAYWKHGVVNPNVFKDLISHSRPVSKQGGTLVYEVPINRTHCTTYLGIFPKCEDTGESLTMRIVANISEGRPDVPGGGQKGVITMYPLPGGSGVIELGPKWTWTPPWVNNNVPIN